MPNLPVWLRPKLTPARMGAAFAVAIVSDAVQLLLGPIGWFWPDQVIDVLATIATTLLIGFHPLLLPTFILELVPLVGMVPTWTGCVAAVVALRRRQQRALE